MANPHKHNTTRLLPYLVRMGDLPLQVCIARTVGQLCQTEGGVWCGWGGGAHEQRVE